MPLLVKKDNSKKLLIDFLKKSFHTIFPGYKIRYSWYVDLLLDRLQAVAAGKVKRLMINMPPRSLKSLLVSVSWPAWLLGCNPQIRIIVASYSSALSIKHSLDTRCIMTTDWYKNMFPSLILSKEQNTKCKFQTNKQGFRLATSIGGTLTGEGADILIADDPLSPLQGLSRKLRTRAIDWFEQTFISRLNDRRKGAVIIVMHRLHSEDLCGYLLNKPGNTWEQLCLPLIAEEPCNFKKIMSNSCYKRDIGHILDSTQYWPEEIGGLKMELGSAAFAAQYQQHPISYASALIKKEWIKRYKTLPEDCNIIHSWDTANSSKESSDYSVGIIFAHYQTKWYIVDIVRGRWDYTDLKIIVQKTVEQWPAHAILIEEKASGQQLCQELKNTTSLPIIGRKSSLDKVSRLTKVSPLIEAGHLFLPITASWLQDFEYEVFSFPHSTNDDQIDSLVQYLEWQREKNITEPTIRIL